MLRLLVTSEAFCAQAAPSPAAAATDPENKLLSHWTLRRMEADRKSTRLNSSHQ